MKDFGEAAYILGIKIYRDRSKRLIGLIQDTYIDKVLKRFNMQDSKKSFLPMSHGASLCKTQCPSTPDEKGEDECDSICFRYWVHHVFHALFTP
jgi:hypothetical protein